MAREASSRKQVVSVPAACVTEATLLALFREEKVLTGRYRLPSSDGFRNLADTIHRLRTMAQLRGGPRAEASAQTSQFVSGLDMIDGVLPSMIADRQQAASMLEGSENWYLVRSIARDLAALRALADAIAGVRDRPHLLLPINKATAPCDRWHDFVGPLAEVFRVAVATTNPGLQLKFSNTGPISRFLAAVIPLITGEMPTLNSVARQLQRHWDNKQP